VGESSAATQSKAQADVEADGAIDCQMDSAIPYLPSLSPGSFWRYYLRQEPHELAVHVRICAGGAGYNQYSYHDIIS
jgi:hypothetical protein